MRDPAFGAAHPSVRLATAVALALVLAGCAAAAAPRPSPSVAPTPTPTPDPHLHEPASVDAVFSALNAAGLRVIGNNADRGASGEPVKRINATYAGWPLILSQYGSSASLLKARRLDPKIRPGQDQPPFTLAGLNILVEFGPHLQSSSEPAPEARFVDAARSLAAALDPLLGPLTERSVVAVAPAPAASPAPSTAPPIPSGTGTAP